MQSCQTGVSYVQYAYDTPPHCAVRVYELWRLKSKRKDKAGLCAPTLREPFCWQYLHTSWFVCMCLHRAVLGWKIDELASTQRKKLRWCWHSLENHTTHPTHYQKLKKSAWLSGQSALSLAKVCIPEAVGGVDALRKACLTRSCCCISERF